MFLYCNDEQIVTGGQKYEDMLFHILESVPGLQVDRLWLHNVTVGYKKYFAMCGNMRQLGRLRGYDLVFFNSAHFLYFLPLIWRLKMIGIKTAVVHHHFLFHQHTGWRRRFYRMLELPFLRAASDIIVPSPYINDLSRKIFPGRQIHYWQIPFETSPSALQPNPQEGNLLYIGTIESRKGLVHLVNAMVLLKKRRISCRLTVVGKTVDAAYRQRLDNIISEESLDVRFTGYVSDGELSRIISEADLFTFPSRLEGYGMVICESMTNGLPVICFDNSAMPYTVKDGVNGLLVPDGDEVVFADAISRAVTDRSLRERLSRGALDTVASFMTPERFTETVIRDTLSIIGGGGEAEG